MIACVAEGVDVSAFNSVQNAADVEAIRQALGYDAYNFYGVSYGTLLGLHLLRDHPENLRTVILDGVVPTHLNFIPKVTANTDRVFKEIIQTCAQDEACSATYPNLEERFFALVDQLNESPTTVRLEDSETGARVDARLDGDTLVDVLFQAFYLPDSYAYFPKLVSNLEAGDMTFVEQIWPLFAFDRTLSEGMYFSVICAEDADFQASELALDGVHPYFAEGAAGELESYADACAIWRVDQLPSNVNDPVVGDTPALLLSGFYDPITPPYFAQAAADFLPNDSQAVDPTGSHGVAFGDPCMDSIIRQFLDAPDQEPDTACLADIAPQEFAPQDALSLPFVGQINQLSDEAGWTLGLASIFLLVVLSAFVVLPLAWLVRVLSTKERPPEDPSGKRLRWAAGILAILFGLVALGFVAGAVYYIFDSLMSGLAMIFAVSADSALVFGLPYLLAVLALAMLGVAFLAWRNGYWSTLARIYYSVVTVSAIAYVIVLASSGMMSVLI